MYTDSEYISNINLYSRKVNGDFNRDLTYPTCLWERRTYLVEKLDLKYRKTTFSKFLFGVEWFFPFQMIAFDITILSK